MICRTIFSFSFSVTLLFFGGFHFWLVFNDKTTLETDLRSFLRFGERPRNVPYRRNWCIVMDSNPWIWFIPVHGEDFKFSWDFLEVGLPCLKRTPSFFHHRIAPAPAAKRVRRILNTSIRRRCARYEIRSLFLQRQSEFSSSCFFGTINFTNFHFSQNLTF